MERLNDELLLNIFKFLSDPWELMHLAHVSRRLRRVSSDQTLWYHVFCTHYTQWSNHVRFSSNGIPLIDWRRFVLRLAKEQRQSRTFTFEHVSDMVESYRLGKRKRSDNVSRTLSPKHSIVQTGPGAIMGVSTQLPESTSRSMDRSHLVSDLDPPVDDSVNGTENPPFRIQDPLVVDIDRLSGTGIVATGKHRKRHGRPPGLERSLSEHKILFWHYPSWRLVRTLELSMTPAEMSCQIVGIQSIYIAGDQGMTKIRVFALAIGVPLLVNNDLDGDDRVDKWNALLIYRLYEDGSTECLAHLGMDNSDVLFLGREVFFFSDASWGQYNDGDYQRDPSGPSLRQWISIVAPQHADYDPHHTLFVLAIGPTFPDVNGVGHLIRLDIRGQANVCDPVETPIRWEVDLNRFIPMCPTPPRPVSSVNNVRPASFIATMRLGDKISCMTLFRYPPHLNHLICTGSYQDGELSIYDWRFGIKVGSLPWATKAPTNPARNRLMLMARNHRLRIIRHLFGLVNEEGRLEQMEANGGQLPMEGEEMPAPPDEEDDEDEEEVGSELGDDVRPWGLETTFVLPPAVDQAGASRPSQSELAQRGIRLIAVGDNRKDKLEIKVWDISYLLKRDWDPLLVITQGNVADSTALRQRFPWWPRGTQYLRELARNTLLGHAGPHPSSLPLSPTQDEETLVLAHAFEGSPYHSMPVKYAAYNVMNTTLFLLTELGHITVMDIESGKVIATIPNVAAGQRVHGKDGHIAGIDVNIIGGREVVVTSREGLFRCLVTL